MSRERIARIYLIPGMGADGRLFHGWSFPGLPTQVVSYIPPMGSETLRNYAGRLLQQIDSSEPFALLGVSMGGMLAVEIAKQVPVQRLILISSAKCRAELPWWWRLPAAFPIVRAFPDRWIPGLHEPASWLMGANREPYRTDFEQMASQAGPQFLKWAVQAVATWDNITPPPDFLHIHGNRDRMLLPGFVDDAEMINGGGHWMVQTHRKQLLDRVGRYLQSGY